MNEKNDLRKPLPSFLEILSIWLLADMISLALAIWLNPFVSYRVLVSYTSHVPQFLIPFIWFQLRLKPALSTEKKRIFHWRKGSTKTFLIFASILAALNLLDEVVEGRGLSQPSWVESGVISILLVLIFQGVFVGFSEEMMMRPAFHLPLKLKWEGKSNFPWALIVTSIAFSSNHLFNYFLGQPFGASLIQAITAFIVSLIFGYFYEKTENYLGTALLHNSFDIAGAIGILLVTLML